MHKLYPILLVVFILPLKSIGQPHEGLAQILTTVLESTSIQPYLPHNTDGDLNIHYLLASNNVPSRIEVMIDGKMIPVITDPEGLSGNILRVAKLIWRKQKAKVVLKGPGNFFARYRLHYEDESWEIGRAFVRGIALRNGKKNKSWDIKF